MARKFMFVCFGLLALAGAYHLGAQNTVAQSADSRIVAADILWAYSNDVRIVAVTDLGDVYSGSLVFQYEQDQFHYETNVFSSAGVVGSDPSSLNDLKARIR